MLGRNWYALIFVLLSFVRAEAEATCVQSNLLTHSVVSIARYFDHAERTAQPDLVGIQGTGWFNSPTTIVTVEHVATAMGLSRQHWKLINIQDGVASQSIYVRIQRLAGSRAEKLVVLELQTPFPRRGALQSERLRLNRTIVS